MTTLSYRGQWSIYQHAFLLGLLIQIVTFSIHVQTTVPLITSFLLPGSTRDSFPPSSPAPNHTPPRSQPFLSSQSSSTVEDKDRKFFFRQYPQLNLSHQHVSQPALSQKELHRYNLRLRADNAVGLPDPPWIIRAYGGSDASSRLAPDSNQNDARQWVSIRRACEVESWPTPEWILEPSRTQPLGAIL